MNDEILITNTIAFIRRNMGLVIERLAKQYNVAADKEVLMMWEYIDLCVQRANDDKERFSFSRMAQRLTELNAENYRILRTVNTVSERNNELERRIAALNMKLIKLENKK